MPNETNSNPMFAELNINPELDSSSYRYLMQYQFNGSGLMPSFSSLHLIPVNTKFVYLTYEDRNTWGSDYLNFFQISALWESAPGEKHKFKERYSYHSARFSFFYRKANKDAYKMPDFFLHLSKVTVVLKRDLFRGRFFHPNQPGMISFGYENSHCYGNFPLHFQRLHSLGSPKTNEQDDWMS